MKTWKIKKRERRGVVPNKCWVVNEKGESALFKPYDEFSNPIDIEMRAYKLASALGIPCARIEEATIEGVDGIVSYDFREPEYVYRYGGHLPRISMQEIQDNERLKSLEMPIVDMLFFDCLTKNPDRHGANWEPKINTDCEYTGIADIFDHGFCFENAVIGESQFLWDKKPVEYIFAISFNNLFMRLCESYPKRMGELLNKCGEIELDDFCTATYRNMKAIYGLVVKGD
jgi:hypothetical protein